ncbi:MAG: DVUA0089 family protein [Fimbriimonadales bacterium]|nr:DVUA0089 family protein [Fimbriimonadales bacterium]
MQNAQIEKGALRRLAGAVLASLALLMSAHPQTWNEQGDAGSLPETAQSTGAGALSAIQGTLQGYYDVDMYAITITDPANFSASVSSGFDSQLWLFDADGKGVSFGEDINGVQGGLDSSCIPAPGVYYIAVSWYPNAALGCDEGRIWNSSPWNQIRCPDGPERTSRVAGWARSGGTGEYSYTISLQGAASATPGDPADCPPMAAWDEFSDGGGDAGDLPETAQSLRAEPIVRITGDNAENDVDMYTIQIPDPSAFSAVVQSGFDSQLWLFDADGKGVSFGEDTSGVHGYLDSTCIPGPGIYYLAVSRYPNMAQGCGGGAIWQSTPWGEIRCPDGAESSSRVASWRGNVSAGGAYTIRLQGVVGATAGDPADCGGCQQHNGDVDNNGCVDDADLLSVLFGFGSSGGNLGRVDVNCDQVVDDADLLLVLFNFGSGC